MRITPTAWQALRELAHGLGFLDLGAAAAGDLGEIRHRLRPDAPRSSGLEEWLAAGHSGEMSYIGRTAAERNDPTVLWPAARTALVGLVAYDSGGEPGDAADGEPGEAAGGLPGNAEAGGGPGPRGRVSRYAWGRDYHLVVKRMLMALGRALEREVPGAQWRTSIDRGAAMEKPLAVLAGLGWIGKHGNLLRTEGSSWHFIGVLLTNASMDGDGPAWATDHCGTCTACIDACPTGAIVAPQVVDARRCISHATIEIGGASDRTLRAAQGSWIFGCDACQDACPWNRHRSRRGHPRFSPTRDIRGPLLSGALRMDEAAFQRATPKSALKRAGRTGFVRNAATAAGNSGDTSLVPLLGGLLADPAPAVRAHAAWALGRLGTATARVLLDAARTDPDASVRDEVEAALSQIP